MICEIDGWVLGGVQFGVLVLFEVLVIGAFGCCLGRSWRGRGGAVRGAGVQSSARFSLSGVYAGAIVL